MLTDLVSLENILIQFFLKFHRFLFFHMLEVLSFICQLVNPECLKILHYGALAVLVC